MGGHAMTTVAVVLVAGALATGALGARADANLVSLAGLGAARDEVVAATLVTLKDALLVKLEQAESAKDVGGDVLIVYSYFGHEDAPSWSGPRGALTPPGPLLYLTAVLSHSVFDSARIIAIIPLKMFDCVVY
jgi:hypothetical protein